MKIFNIKFNALLRTVRELGDKSAMKKIALILSLLVVTSLNAANLQDRGGIKYKINHDEPFSGVSTEKFYNGKKKSATGYSKGLKHGKETIYHSTGAKETENNYSNGKKNGSAKEWYITGQKRIVQSFKNGLENGEHKKWHRNGQLLSKVNYKNGKRNGTLIYYYKNGVKRGRIELIAGEYSGLVTAWYINTKKEDEGYYLKGKRHGIYKKWFENGQLESSGEYIHGKMNGLFTEWTEKGKKKKEERYKNGKLDGLTIIWALNGWNGITEKHYKLGSLNGLYRSWMDGEIAGEEIYLHGRSQRTLPPKPSDKKFVLENGLTYYGSIIDGQMYGKGMLITKDGYEIYANFGKSKVTEGVISHHEKGFYYKGEIKKLLAHGEGWLIDSIRNSSYQGSFVKGKIWDGTLIEYPGDGSQKNYTVKKGVVIE